MGGLDLMARAIVPSFTLDEGFLPLKQVVVERTGHFYYTDKDDLLWERIRKRLRATGDADCTRYMERLRHPSLGPVEWSRLEAEITIGETFFFRYAEQFTALRQLILPELIERKRSEKRLRIWSAGCATGAEAYSLAILIKELLGDELSEWRVSIVGTDINEDFLKIARSGRFGPWALRTLTPEQTAAYFVQATERAQWQLRPEFRSLVRFERHNLLSLLDGTSPLQYTEFDLILCRNVLIYFHPDMVNRIVERLRDTLLDGGWMLLGHAEPNPTFSMMMRALNLPGTTAYRRLPPEPSSWQSENETVPAPIKPWEAFVWETSSLPLPAPKPAPARLPTAPIVPLPPAPSDRGDATHEEIGRLADAGDFVEAAALCRRALAGQPLDAVLHFYRGLLAQAMKDPSEAEKAFRDSVYLDKNFVMAHYHLGIHLVAEGQIERGQRSIANAARAASSLAPDHVLAEADGLTAGEFRNLARTHLASSTYKRGKR